MLNCTATTSTLLFKTCNVLIPALSCSTPHSKLSVWPKPGNEPLVDVNRAILVAVHYQAAVLTTIRPRPKRHVLLVFTDVTCPGCITFVNDKELFPKAQAPVRKHLHKAVASPIIIYHAVIGAPLVSLFRGSCSCLGMTICCCERPPMMPYQIF